MLVRVGLLHKKPDWEMEAFRHYWLTDHADLARQLKGLRGYVQNHVIDVPADGDGRRGPYRYDGFPQLWFDDDAVMRAAVAALGPALAVDEKHFIAHLSIVVAEQTEVIAPPPNGRAIKTMSLVKRRDIVAEQTEVIAPPPNGRAIKTMSLVKRRDDISPERFRDEWHRAYAPLVAAMPGVRGYRQDVILERQVPKGTPVGYDGLPVDGVSELWFGDRQSIGAAWGSPAGQAALAHARTFIAESTTFLVETFVIV